MMGLFIRKQIVFEFNNPADASIVKTERNGQLFLAEPSFCFNLYNGIC